MIHWFMLSSCCQSNLAAANGSNACVVISVLMGYVFLKSKILQENISYRSTAFINMFLSLLCGAIDTGNYLYNFNELSGFIHIMEAMEVIPPGIDVTVTEERNIYYNNDSELSLAPYLQQHREKETAGSCFCVVVAGGKAFSLFLDRNKVFFIDSHENGDYRGRFCIIETQNSPKKLPPYILCNDDEVIYACFVHVK